MTFNGLGQLFLGLQLNINNNLTTTNKYVDRKEQRTAHSGLVSFKMRSVQCSVDTVAVNQTLVLRINICGKNRHLRQAENRL